MARDNNMYASAVAGDPEEAKGRSEERTASEAERRARRRHGRLQRERASYRRALGATITAGSSRPAEDLQNRRHRKATSQHEAAGRNCLRSAAFFADDRRGAILVASAATAAATTAAVAAASSAASTPAAATATAATAAATFLARLGFVDRQRAAIVFLAVESGDGGLRLLIAGHLNKAESLAAARVSVRDHFRALDGAKSREQTFQIGAAHAIPQISDIQFLTQDEPPVNRWDGQ